MNIKEKISFRIDDSKVGIRLDKALAAHTEIGNRSRALHLIQSSLVTINGKIAKASIITKTGDLIEATLPEPENISDLKPYDFPLEIVFEDSDLLVVNKPAGLVVHPAAGHMNDTLVNALLYHTQNLSMKFGENRPGIVHRIDKETSGLLVVAKNDRVHEGLTSQFKQKTTHRIYFAVVHGVPKNSSGKIQSYLLRHPVDRKRYASVLGEDNKILRLQNPDQELGKWAVTHYEVIKSVAEFSLVKLKLETGRTHQIRVHLSELGHPIVGDSTYGADKKIKSIHSISVQKKIKSLNRFLLHAAELGFIHPISSEALSFKSDWPKEDFELIQSWGLL